MAEVFDVVDEHDEVVGRARRDEVHGNPSLTHRVAHVLVFNAAGRLYLQRRAADKDVQPDKWDTSVGGHVDAGEAYEAAASREMREELGIVGPPLERLYRYRHENDYESEMVTAYRVTWDGPIEPDPSEVSEGRFWTLEEIDAAAPEIFTPNFLDELARFRAWREAGASARRRGGTMPTPTARRVENALWGLFIGDALSMPVHWHYDRKNIEREYDGGIAGYEAPHHPHPESFMVGMGYRPDVERARELGRPYDILHEHVRFYDASYSPLEIDRGEREGQHGNAVPAIDERYHYHHGLRAGENTLGAHLVRVLLRSLASTGEYDPRAFIDAFVHHLATPGLNRDPYTEIYIRSWFEAYTRGTGIFDCAESQRRVWSIGSHGGMIRPMALSLFYPGDGYLATGMALEHQRLTHRSETVSGALTVAVPLVHDLVAGADPAAALAAHARGLRQPAVTGRELFRAYREHNGPGNIPDAEMWRLHTELRREPFDLESFVERVPESEAVMGVFATACYPEHGLPLALSFARKHDGSMRASLLANANAGGDNVHRGMVLGMLVGAASDSVPDDLKEGLADAEAIANEIDAALTALG